MDETRLLWARYMLVFARDRGIVFSTRVDASRKQPRRSSISSREIAMSEPRVAILMVRRDESGNLFVVDGNGKERTASTDTELRSAIDAVLEDPSIPDTEQVGNLEQTAERILIQATASFLPNVARPLAGPLVRDVTQVMRKFYEFPETKKEERAARPPAHERSARARSHRIRSSRMRLGGAVKRKGLEV